MNDSTLEHKAAAYLERLCYGFASRRTGSAGNRSATDYVARVVSKFGFDVECPVFRCIDWTHGDVLLNADGEMYEAYVSPYAIGCDVRAKMAIATTVDELAAVEVSGKALLLIGEIAREQLMPKNFIFYNPDSHKQIVGLLEQKQPAAVISATTRDPELAGGIYPFSLIEDGDFDIPSVYMTAEEGARLAHMAGREIELRFVAERVPSNGCNVIARKERSRAQKLTIFAHIDAKDGTPGALDNGTGVVILMLLAEILKDYDGGLEVELVALNGEDYYSAAGEMQYWIDYADDFGRIFLGTNIDAAGYRDGDSAFSLYGCSDQVSELIRRVLGGRPGLVEGEPWYQSDHSMFIQRGRPALAITSEKFMELTTHITHTEADTPELVDVQKLVTIANGLHDLILALADAVR